jgi:hypothetical protein
VLFLCLRVFIFRVLRDCNQFTDGVCRIQFMAAQIAQPTLGEGESGCLTGKPELGRNSSQGLSSGIAAADESIKPY